MENCDGFSWEGRSTLPSDLKFRTIKEAWDAEQARTMRPRVDLRRLNHSDPCVTFGADLSFARAQRLCTKDRKDREAGQAFVQGDRYTSPRSHPAGDFRCDGTFPLAPPVRSDWRRGELRSGEICIGGRMP